MSFALLTKVAGMSTAVSTTLGSAVYYSFRDSKFEQHLQNIQFQNEEIERLKEKKHILTTQLGDAKKNISVTVSCRDGKNKTYTFDSKTKSANFKCSEVRTGN